VIEKLIPGAIKEYRFHPIRAWRFDYAWPSYMIALDIEGGIWTNGRHVRGKGFIGDLSKYNEAAMMGWCVLRVTTAQFKSGEAANLVMLAIETKGGRDASQKKPRPQRESAGKD